MNTRVSLATFAGILGLAAVAQAGTISSPAIFGSHDQNQAYCVVLNAGTTTQTVTVRILTESGTAVVVGTQTIAPGQFVVAFANISFGVAYACNATAGEVGRLSGALTITDTVPDGFGSSLHRAIRSAALR